MNRARRLLRVMGWTSVPGVLLIMAAASAAQTREIQEPAPPGQRFDFKIGPKTPVKDLLPPNPRLSATDPWLGDDLRLLPEVRFMQPLVSKGRNASERNAEHRKLMEQTAHIIAKVNHLNKQKTDYFLDQLLSRRADLAGLPFLKGEACRQTDARRPAFTRAVNNVRSALQQADIRRPGPQEPAHEIFWRMYQELIQVEAVAPAAPEGTAVIVKEGGPELPAGETSAARIAALMQMLATESHLHPGLVQRLKDAKDAEATPALARLALFAAEEDARKAALVALQKRATSEVDDTLLQGFRYPWPQVAGRAAEAVVALKRTNLVPRLVDLLDQPDPREPVTQENDGGKVQMVRELVRLNHHQNCLLCHAPANTPGVPPDAATGAVPIPGQPLPSLSEGYNFSSPDILVRADVTYLRPDFSLLQPVARSIPWPRLQRFDFLVRTRELNEKERQQWREIFAARPASYVSPYHTAVATALRELTGRDAAPTAAAWRQVLRQ